MKSKENRMKNRLNAKDCPVINRKLAPIYKDIKIISLYSFDRFYFVRDSMYK